MTPSHNAIAFEAFGARITIRAAESFASDLRPRLPPRARPITTEDSDTVYSVESVPPRSVSDHTKYRLTRDGVGIGSCRSLSQVCRELESDMHFQVALAARDFLFVHAGVVQWKGQAVVVPGRTETGKSSLVMALVNAGGEYFSDEYAVLDREGRVHAYPKPLSQRREGGPPRLHTAEALGGQQEAPAVPMGLTVITRFRDGATWNPQRITKARAMMALFENTVVARSRPEFALSVLAKAVTGTGGLEGDRGEASETASALLDALKALPAI
ncbi:MAG: hypothetical protein IIB36_10980 [Gemmatimonadetes bacterium]|nr:hypothetical protein [Gemmatimonadota bacterium]